MKRRHSKRLVITILLCVTLAYVFIPNINAEAANFSTGYTITGDGASDMVSIAVAQAGKTQSQMGYTYAWCAAFVSDCAYIAEQSTAIPWNAGVAGMYSAVINAGGYRVSTAQQGDLVFYYCNSCGCYVHVGLMKSATTSIQGNIYSNNVSMVYNDMNPAWYNHSPDGVVLHSSYGSSPVISVIYVRPNYQYIPQETIPTSVSLNKTSATLTSKGATVSLTATVSPSNATDKSVTWKSSNTSVATVSSSGVVTAVANGTATITATTNSGGKTATCSVTVAIPTVGADGWYYTTMLPSGVTSTNYDIQYQNIYHQYATSSPGTGWTDTGVDKKEYTKSGSTYEKDSPLQTSDTVQLVEYYYYHYCGPNTAWNDVNYYVRDGYIHRDEMHLDYFKVYEYASGTDLENSNMIWYHLKWADGSGYDAYCHRYSTGGTCDGSGGEHGERSCYWYKKYVYQNYTVQTLNQYQKTAAWGTSKDSSATTVNIRYRLKPTSVSLNKTTTTLTSKGATVSLTATIAPTNAGCKDVTWKSSNTSVATVSSSGVVTAVGNGTATITATTVSGAKTATCQVTVCIATTGVSLNKTSATLNNVGQTVQLTATVAPSNAANKNITWKSSNTSVATVSSKGVVTAVGNGTAKITATTNSGGKTATCQVTVSIATTGVSLNKTTATLNSVGQTVQLTATVSPTNAANKNVTWKSSDTSVATVSSSGLVTAVGNGTATITVTTASGSKTATCKVTVSIAVTGVSLDKTSVTLKTKGETVTLTATVAPSNAANKNVTWKSSDTSVATVSSSGVVTAVGNGTATITVTTASGSKTATCQVTVKTTLDTPVVKSVSNGTNGVKISWNTVDGAEKYRVFRKTATTGWKAVGNTASTSFVDTTAVSGNTYTYTVRCISSDDATYTSAYDTVGKSLLYIEAPSVTSVSLQVNGTKVTWNKVGGAEKYRVFRKTASTSWVAVGDTTGTSFTDTKTESGVTYSYTIRCISSDGKTFTSAYDTKGKSVYYIAAPVITSASSYSGGVTITWDKVSGAEKYRVFRKTATSGWVAVGNTTSSSYTDTKVEEGTIYSYTVRCISSDGKTFTSAYDTSGKSIAYLTTPQVSNVGLHVDGIKVSWDKISGAEKYRVYRKTASTGWKVVGDTTANNLIDTTAVSGTTYSYTVRCVSSDGKTFTSGYTSGKSIAYISAPEVVTLNVNANGVKITWDKVNGAEKYRVFRKDSTGVWKKLADTTSVSYTDTTTVVGETYSYTIRCISSDGSTYTSAYDTKGKSITPVSAPKIKQVSSNTKGAYISWSAVSGAEKYRVYRLEADGTWKKVADVTTNYFTDTSVVSGNTYTYTIRCMNADGSYTSAYDTKGVSIKY